MFENDNQTIFINKDLPVYIWISTSPNENSKKIRLKSQQSKKYTNPMYFDTEGMNTFHSPWAVDTVTKKYASPQKDIIFEVMVDGLAPKTYSTLSGAPKYISSGKTYYGKGLQLALKSSDAVSGVKQILYSINGAAYAQYNGLLSIDNEGSIALKYYSTDIVGNVEGSNNKNFIVDITPPVIKYEVTGSKVNETYGPDAKIVVSSTDNLSGVANQYYEIDGVKRVYSYPIPASYFKSNGDHSIKIYSVDNVKNSNKDGSDGINLNIKYDSKAPDVNITIEGDQFKGKYLFVSERTKVKLSANDVTGVKEITYGINKTSSNIYSEPFLLNNQKGIQKIYFKAKDVVNNLSDVHTKTVYLDNVKPVSGINYLTPKFFNRDTLFINSKTQIQLYSNDNNSGVKITEYSIDNETDFKAYTGKFKIPSDGFHTIYFKSTDNVNNVETIKKSTCLVDNTAPKIYVNFSIQPIDSKVEGGNTYDVYPKYTKIYIAATDKYSGTNYIYYTVNGKYKAQYTSAQAFQNRHLIDKSGKYTVEITATDKLGNEDKFSKTFYISDK